MSAHEPTPPAASHPLALAPVAAPPASVDGFVREFLRNLNFERGVALSSSAPNDRYMALAYTVRDYLMARWLEDQRRQREAQAKGVCYLSAEYLLGRQLDNNLLAARLTEVATEAMAACGIDIDELRQQEVEPGLGNGGLGRLAACFIDSLATMSVPSIGYGIRYEYGIFRQTFVDGQQVEQPDAWLTLGSPWEFPHPEAAQKIWFGGHTEQTTDDDGVSRSKWVPGWHVLAVPYNYMVPGYHNGRVNTLRLWRAVASDAFDLRIFNSGDYEEAVRAQTFAENISKVLYPEDSTPQGKELRLQQQYFFVAASIADFLDHQLSHDYDLEKLPDRVIFQLNDTHPVIAVPEFMRVLVDERGMDWDAAWAITQKCFAYTCHTLLPEALEVWSVELLGRLLPRHLEIIYRINEDFLLQVRERFGDDEMRIRNMSIISENPRSVRMAYLATVAGAKVNGVAELHSQLLREKVLPDFDEFYPGKFTNVTNGVTPRRFVRLANPGLAGLITEALGAGWTVDLERLRGLEAFAEDPEFRDKFAEVKRANKRVLGEVLRERDGFALSEDHMLDVMVKRLHEYKRQMLKVLHIVTAYEGIVSGRTPASAVQPRTFIFGAKAAPGYAMAKRIIHLINAVGSVVNDDPRVEGRLKVLFPPNYNVTLAERVIPAADLSEQISLAGKEASGTGNMKFALNGALTIGTDDGANVEIRELVGDDNFFLFGMTEPEVEALWAKGYKPAEFYQADPSLRRAIDLIASGAFSDGDRSVFEPIVSNLLYDDRFMVLADYSSYIAEQAKVDVAYADQDAWTKASILNVARTGFFSSDRSIRDYIDRIWHTPPIL